METRIRTVSTYNARLLDPLACALGADAPGHTFRITRLRASSCASFRLSSSLFQLAVTLDESPGLDEDVLRAVPGVVADQQARENEHQPFQHEHEGGVFSSRPASGRSQAHEGGKGERNGREGRKRGEGETDEWRCGVAGR